MSDTKRLPPIPKTVHTELKTQASREGKTLTQKLIEILVKALGGKTV